MWKSQLKLRLWVVSVALFAAGLIGRVMTDAMVDSAASYRIATGIQIHAYLAGIAVWIASLVRATFDPKAEGNKYGCLIGIGLTIASFFAIISSARP